MHPRALRSAVVASVGAVVIGVLGLVGPAGAVPVASQVIPAKGVNPCKVLDSDVIAETLGGDASRPTRAGRHICRWFVDGAVTPDPDDDRDDDRDDDEEERTVVLVSVERYRGRAQRDIAQNMREPSAVEVTGLSGADIAYYDLEVVPPTITVVQGSRLFVVQMNDLDTDDETIDALSALAASVLENL